MRAARLSKGYSVEARSNIANETDNVVGIVQIERAAFKGRTVTEVVDQALADLKLALMDYAGAEKAAARIPE